jgi:hypothetical protein
MAKGISKTAPTEEKSELVKELSRPVSQQEREEMKKELLKELMGDRNILEVHFKKTVVVDSGRFADMLNARPKVVDTWEVEDGMKSGYIEEVKIMGAVAQVPRGVAVLVPDIVAKMFRKYQKAEKESGFDIPNQSGGLGIRADRDDRTREALGL